jgi:hypothetical protein
MAIDSPVARGVDRLRERILRAGHRHRRDRARKQQREFKADGPASGKWPR